MGMGSSWCPRSPCCGKSGRQAKRFVRCGLFKPHWLGRRFVPVLLKRRGVFIGQLDLATQGRKRIAACKSFIRSSTLAKRLPRPDSSSAIALRVVAFGNLIWKGICLTRSILSRFAVRRLRIWSCAPSDATECFSKPLRVDIDVQFGAL